MRKTLIVSAAMFGLAVAPALAQMNPATGARPGNIPGTNNSLPLGNTASNIEPGDTSSPIAPHLPTPAIGDNSGPRAYLTAAKQALARHQTGLAQQALEMAETRALDRSVVASAADTPDSGPLVTQISHALDALGHRDWSGCSQMIDQALALTGNGANAPNKI